MLFVHFVVTIKNHQTNIIIIIIIIMCYYILISVQFWDLKANRRVNSLRSSEKF